MITLGITNYNRCELLFESFIRIIDDERIDEILISDDNSDNQIFDDVLNKLEYFKSKNESYNKVKIHRNLNNLGQFDNSKKVVELSKNDWIILLDSDNIIDVDYIDTIYNLSDVNTIYLPSHAICESNTLNYTIHSNTLVNRIKYKQLLSTRSIWDPIFNTGNFYFNKQTYLNCVNQEETIINSYGGSPYYLIYLWMKNNMESKILVTENLKYIHRLDHSSYTTEESSLYIKNASNTGILIDGISIEVSKW
jgi:hypothetical protein